jgi:hypothetical protein
MGIKIFDLPPNGLKDGAVADMNLDQSIATPNEVLSRNVEKDGTENKVLNDEVGVAVRAEIISERVSPDDPLVRKYVQYDANDNIVSSDPEGSDEFAAAVGEEGQSGVKASMKTMLALHMLRVELPIEVIDEINSHIDETIENSHQRDASKGLVGQISQNDKSSQLKFDLSDEVGKLVKGQLDKAGKSYVQKGFNRDVTADAFESWTVHSYAGDFNPLHSHGVRTPAGLSCILYLKVPEQIEKISDPSEEGLSLNESSGAVDGFTYFTWGDGDNQDINRFRPITEEYVKPEVGTMLIFPNWLRHAVMPFYGDGERRTFSANMNIFENSSFDNMSEEDKMKHIENMRK